MIQKILSGCLIIGMVLCSACSNKKMPQTDPPLPQAEAASLWNYITAVLPYKDWAFWPDHQGTYNSKAPHAPQHKIFVNTPALESTGPPLQYGSIIVKENLSPANELKAVTAMYKVKGYNPAAGDWFWAYYRPSGDPIKTGKVKSCITCHSPMADNDFILVHEFK
ncbi:MAG: cytochrome P460 family protein [Candidatus Electrothrix sp. YB6]